MATIALRVPTVLPTFSLFPQGQCYILFERGPTSARTIIAEKVRAELRKARAGALTGLADLLPPAFSIGLGPLDELAAIQGAYARFTAGGFLLLHDGLPVVDLDETVVLDRRSSLHFVAIPDTLYPPLDEGMTIAREVGR